MYLVSQNKALGARILSDAEYRLVTGVAALDEPLASDEAVLSRLDLGSPEDPAERAYVDSLFSASRKAAEAIIGKPIGEQEFEYMAANFPCSYVIELLKMPLISVKNIKYTKDDGTTVTWYDSETSPITDPQAFVIENGCQPGSIFLRNTKSWPTDILINGFPLKIRFTAGIDPVPDDLMQYLRLIFGLFYENRELALDEGSVKAELPNVTAWLKTNYGFEAFS